MLTAKDVMESCWEEDDTYEEVVKECKKFNLPIPSSTEYASLCEFNNEAIKDWKNSLDNQYDDPFDTSDEIFIEEEFLGDDR